jgi:pyruvate kinase
VAHLIELKEEKEFKNFVKNAYESAKKGNAKAIVLASFSGFTARLISHFRIEKPFLVATNNKKTYNQLSLLWGAEGFYSEQQRPEQMLDAMIKEKNVDESGIVKIIGNTPEGEKMKLL